MKTTITKGEWKSTPNFDWVGAEGKPICEISKCNGNKETMEANARLIAAAPELLEALQMYIDRIEMMNNTTHLKKHGTYQKALRAIKKATE